MHARQSHTKEHEELTSACLRRSPSYSSILCISRSEVLPLPAGIAAGAGMDCGDCCCCCDSECSYCCCFDCLRSCCRNCCCCNWHCWLHAPYQNSPATFSRSGDTPSGPRCINALSSSLGCHSTCRPAAAAAAAAGAARSSSTPDDVVLVSRNNCKLQCDQALLQTRKAIQTYIV